MALGRENPHRNNMPSLHPLISILRAFILACVVLAAVPGCGLGAIDLIDTIIDEIDKEDPPPPAAGDALVSINTENGTREVLSGLTTGGGTPFLDARSAVYDKPRDRVLVWEEARAAILEVEGIDGDRQVFSDHVTGDGVTLTAVRSMVMDSADDRIIVLDDAPAGALLVAVDLATGDREVLIDLEAGSNLTIETARGLALNSTGAFAYVGDADRNAVIRISLSTGARALLSGPTTGTGQQFDGIRDLAFEAGPNRLLLLDDTGGALYGVGLAGGDRTVIADAGGAIGALLVDAAVIEIGATEGTVYVAGGTEVWEVETDTGSGDRLSGRTIGSGPLQDRVAGMALDTSRDRLVVVSRD
jgi:hypothetical protein